MAEIARWTTPSITYNPSIVDPDDVNDIFLVVKQNGATLITKDINEAVIDTHGFTWTLTQVETSKLLAARSATIQVDYTDVDGNRYTTVPKKYTITESAINEEI